MRPIIWRCAVAVFFVVSSARAVAAADVWPNYQQVYGLGFASDQEVEGALGTLTFSVAECHPSGFGSHTSRVRVTSSKSSYDKRVIERMLYRAAEFAWQDCQIHFSFAGSPMPDVHRNIDSVELYLPDGNVAVVANQLTGDGPFNVGNSYKWGGVQDVGEQRRQEAAWAAAKVQQGQQRAEANARFKAEQDRKWDRFWSDAWFWIKVALWCAFAAWLFSKRETIMRWYYFLTPHPATSMVEASMHGGANLDDKIFSEIMRPIPGGRIEKEVRAEQAHKLALKAQQYAESKRAEVDRIRAKAEQDTAFIDAQAVLDEAVKAHEKAKAQLDILRKLVR